MKKKRMQNKEEPATNPFPATSKWEEAQWERRRKEKIDEDGKGRAKGGNWRRTSSRRKMEEDEQQEEDKLPLNFRLDVNSG